MKPFFRSARTAKRTFGPSGIIRRGKNYSSESGCFCSEFGTKRIAAEIGIFHEENFRRSIAFQGERGAFSEVAVRQLAGEDSPVLVPQVEDVFRSLAEGRAIGAVVRSRTRWPDRCTKTTITCSASNYRLLSEPASVLSIT